MGAGHVDTLFSEAYDRVLDGARRLAFDDHLRNCAECADGYAHFCASLDAVHALPLQRMPVGVVLPATAPRPAGGVAEWAARLVALPRVHRVQSAAAALAAAAVVAGVAVTLHATGGGGPVTASRPALSAAGAATSTTVNGSPSTCTTTSLPAAANVNGSVSAGAPVVSEAAALPAGFSNSVVVTQPGRPGEELVLATPVNRYAAGQQVLVYARLVGASSSPAPNAPNNSAVVAPPPIAAAPSAAGSDAQAGAALSPARAAILVPCLAVDAESSTGAPAKSDTAPQGAAAGVSGSAPKSRMTSIPVSSLPTPAAGGVLVQVFSVPAGVPSGSTVRLVASVPAGQPAAGQPVLQAVLTITVGS